MLWVSILQLTLRSKDSQFSQKIEKDGINQEDKT